MAIRTISDSTSSSNLFFCLFLCIVGTIFIFRITYKMWIVNHKRRKDLKQYNSPEVTTIPTIRTLISLICPPLDKKDMFRVTWGWICFIFTSFPLVSLWLSLAISISYDFNRIIVNQNHCKPSERLSNFLPSISACIGDFYPQFSIWRCNVMLYVWQRFFAAIVSYYHYEDATKGTCTIMNRFRLLSSFVENIGLVFLSAVSSSDRLIVHEISFGFFCGGAVSVMILTNLLIRQWISVENDANERNEMNVRCTIDTAKKALNWRTKSSFFNIVCLVGALCMYNLSKQCSSYPMYSIFALFEWLYVISGILFHINSEQIELWYVDLSFVHANIDDTKKTKKRVTKM